MGRAHQALHVGSENGPRLSTGIVPSSRDLDSRGSESGP